MFAKLLSALEHMLFGRDHWLENAQAKLEEFKRLHPHLFEKPNDKHDLT